MIQMNWLAILKTILCYLGVPLIEFCHKCGWKQTVYWHCESDELYSQVTGGLNTVVCPECFDKLATQKHISIKFTATQEVVE